MILLITPSARAQQCADALQAASNEIVQVAATLSQAATQLRTQEYVAVVMDQLALEAEPDDSEVVMQHIGAAIPVYVNFAISGTERVVRELRAALHRRQKEALLARQWAEQTLRGELNGTVTALLLSCEMALQAPSLPSTAEAKIRAACGLAQEIRNKLSIPA